MTRIGEIEVINCLLCEDIRMDTTGKFVLVGVTPGGFSVEDFPSAVPMATYLDLKVKKVGDYDLFLQFSGPGPGKGKIKIGLNVRDPGEVLAIVTPRVDLQLAKEGTLSLDVSSDDVHWKNLYRRKISRTPAGEVAAFPPKLHPLKLPQLDDQGKALPGDTQLQIR